MPTVKTPEASIHGRYLVEPAPAPSPLLVGFHGYAEGAEIQLERLRAIPGSDAWTLVSIQGLHRFYRGQGERRTVVASWMTRQDRALAIADNLAYVESAVKAAVAETQSDGRVVFAGFSQGAAMALRAASLLPFAALGALVVGGDVPPDITRSSLARISRAFVGRGTDDTRYSHDQWLADSTRLRDAGVHVEPVSFQGGHDWNEELCAAAGSFLRRVRGHR